MQVNLKELQTAAKIFNAAAKGEKFAPFCQCFMDGRRREMSLTNNDRKITYRFDDIDANVNENFLISPDLLHEKIRKMKGCEKIPVTADSVGPFKMDPIVCDIPDFQVKPGKPLCNIPYPVYSAAFSLLRKDKYEKRQHTINIFYIDGKVVATDGCYLGEWENPGNPGKGVVPRWAEPLITAARKYSNTKLLDHPQDHVVLSENRIVCGPLEILMDFDEMRFPEYSDLINDINYLYRYRVNGKIWTDILTQFPDEDDEYREVKFSCNGKIHAVCHSFDIGEMPCDPITYPTVDENNPTVDHEPKWFINVQFDKARFQKMLKFAPEFALSFKENSGAIFKANGFKGLLMPLHDK